VIVEKGFDPEIPSNQKFGMFFTLVFFLLSGYSLISNQVTMLFVLFVLFVVCALVTLLIPQKLATLNFLWYRLGMFLGKITNPLVMGILFFLFITPIAFVIRLLGRDELKLKSSTVKSYWIERSHNNLSTDFTRQF
jgi:hypothetical protein